MSRPHPPILIGGMGENKTFRLVAEFADACNLFDGPELPHKLEVLQQRCEEVGRDYSEIEKTTLTTFRPDPSDSSWIGTALKRIEYHASLGIDQVIVSFGQPTEPELVDLAAREIVEPSKSIATAGR
jgi:hypothetical protein